MYGWSLDQGYLLNEFLPKYVFSYVCTFQGTTLELKISGMKKNNKYLSIPFKIFFRNLSKKNSTLQEEFISHSQPQNPLGKNVCT